MTKASQEAAAAERLARRTADRQRNISMLERDGGLLHADSPDRVAKRIDRLTRWFASEALPMRSAETPREDPGTLVERARRRAATAPTAPASVIEAARAPDERQLERIINTRDFVDARYLDDGVAAARAVGRVRIYTADGRLDGYGTGSMVSPRLLLTNNHVLPSAEIAAASQIEFNFQDGRTGPLQPKIFRLDPHTFFLTDATLDFALVAVAAAPGELDEFGFNRLIEAEGKVIVGESVTIVQHPGGERKQVALRENRVVDVLDAFLHYETDTEPGSSGSPVFNDQWEVVCLHHASVRAPNHAELGGFANEGIRVSRLLSFIHEQSLSDDARRLRDQLFEPESRPVPSVRRDTPIDTAAGNGARRTEEKPTMATIQTRTNPDGSVQITVPLEITVRVGTAAAAALAAGVAPEAVSIDPDYSSRRGFDPAFLAPHRVPLPTLSAAMRAAVARDPHASDGTLALPYHHYSVIMNGERKIAFVTAVNIDGRHSFPIRREPDKWFFDPRIPKSAQAGNEVYADNKLDRGHLVRRLDPAWGTSEPLAKVANDDTFHFTNCSPQHKDFNQNRTTWAGLEDYILKNADNRDLKVSVFTGPVLEDDDEDYRGIKLPRQFWKVVAMVKTDGALSATAYLLSQESLLGDLEAARRAKEAFAYGQYKTFQVPIARIEQLTGLSFDGVRDADPLAGHEATGVRREIAWPVDIRL